MNALKQYQCPRFHLYNAPEGHDGTCPVCSAQDAELARTRGLWPVPGAAAAVADATGVALPAQPAPAAVLPATTGAPTIGAYAHLGASVEPVVGWLACIAGPDKGRDWRLVGGRNAIGRAEGMPVRLAGDERVSRERHAVVSFDPRREQFSLAPGEGTGLVYRNGEEVLMPVPLAAHDRIEVGASTLVFVPLVGERFTWPD